MWPQTGGTQVDYRLYSATGNLEAAGSPPGIAGIEIELAQPATFLLVVGEVEGKAMVHEAAVTIIPSKQHNDLCSADDECVSGFCRASAFEPGVERCLTPCSRATVLDCKAKGLPGLCVETGADKTPLCAGQHVFGVDNDAHLLKAGEWFYGSITNAVDVDPYLVDLTASNGNYRAKTFTNGGAAVLKVTWLDATGKQVDIANVPKNAIGHGPVLGKGFHFVLVSSADGNSNGYQVQVLAD